MILPVVVVVLIVVVVMILVVCLRIRRQRAFDAAASRAAQPVHLQTFPPAAGDVLLL